MILQLISEVDAELRVGHSGEELPGVRLTNTWSAIRVMSYQECDI